MTAVTSDPRPARSRARLLDAATDLLRSGGPGAVTIEAVTRSANVARATLYRHFSSANDLLAAAFMSLIPPAPMPPDEGSLRERLTAIVVAWAESIAEVPTTLTAMAWLSLGPDINHVPDGRPLKAGGAEVRSLRERIAEQYSAPVQPDLRQSAGRGGTQAGRSQYGFRPPDRATGVRQDQHVDRVRLPGGGDRRRRRVPQVLREGSHRRNHFSE